MSGDDRHEAWLHRVVQLAGQGRFDEAEQACREALGRDPDDPALVHLLALCQHRQDGGDARALETIDRAIALEPDDAGHHALRSRVLASLDRVDDAITAAEAAIRLDPTDPDGHTARGWARFRQQRWGEAEAAARAALELDPDDATATFLLAESLRLQGRTAENRDAVTTQLGRDPLDPVAHVSAGWAALQRGERDAAETHFLEALRIDPRMEMARHGLLESFKSRAPWYAGWLRLNLWAARFSATNRWVVLIGLFVLVRFARTVFKGPLAPVGMLLTVLWLAFALWGHLASGTANALVLLDARARHALRHRERLDALCVGGGVFAGVALMLAGLVPALRPLGPLGAGLFGAAIPFAHTFTNDSRPGVILFGAFGALALVAGGVVAASTAWPGAVPAPWPGLLAGAAFLGVILTTWLANVPALKK